MSLEGNARLLLFAWRENQKETIIVFDSIERFKICCKMTRFVHKMLKNVISSRQCKCAKRAGKNTFPARTFNNISLIHSKYTTTLSVARVKKCLKRNMYFLYLDCLVGGIRRARINSISM